MSNKTRYILGITTLVGVTVLTIYAIKKGKEQKEMDDATMSVEEAMAEVRAQREREKMQAKEDELEDLVKSGNITVGPIDIDVERESMSVEEIQEIRDEASNDANDFVSWNRSFDIVEHAIEEEIENMLDVPFIHYMTEEDKVLRFDANSLEARNQYIRMEMCEWAPREKNYSVLKGLFDVPFEPTNDGDWDLLTKIIDYRSEFFGIQSDWTKDVTYADVILHFGRNASFNVDNSVRHWVDTFLNASQLNMVESREETMEIINELNNHVFHNEGADTYGLFGLTSSEMQEAIRIADRNIDNTVTYEIEFNEFLKACLN